MTSQLTNELPFFESSEKLIERLITLKAERGARKNKLARKYSLSKKDKTAILEKTNYKCHICGGEVALNTFEADHIQAHSSLVNNKLDNFLPSCRLCNNYRWHCDAEEIKWVLKLGVWLRGEMMHKTSIGLLASEKFIKHEIRREGRKKH
jgi:hypothetical protein